MGFIVERLPAYEERTAGALGAVFGSPGKILGERRSRERFPAASLIKIPVLIYLLQECEAGNASLAETVRLKGEDKVGGSGVLLELHEGIHLTLQDLASLMIVVSDNTATNLLIDRLGIEKIQGAIRSMGFQETLLARKMMAAPEAPPANFTTPLEMYQMLEKLQQGKLLPPPETRLALEILFRQQYNEKIPLLLPRHVRVAHKTGEISGVRHDCGIVQENGRTLILSLLTQNVADEVGTDRILAELSLEIYNACLKGG